MVWRRPGSVASKAARPLQPLPTSQLLPLPTLAGHQVQHAHGGRAGGELPGHQNLPVRWQTLLDQFECNGCVNVQTLATVGVGNYLGIKIFRCGCFALDGRLAKQQCLHGALVVRLGCGTALCTAAMMHLHLAPFLPPPRSFYYRCTHCSAEFCMKTDPKNAGGCCACLLDSIAVAFECWAGRACQYT